jgi:Opioid growth factor receptor (OGFr) conserved region
VARPSLDTVRSFLEGTGTDDRGRSLEQILRQDDHWLEYTHDFIQWLYPIDSPSGVNPNAPVLTALEAGNLGANSKIAANMRRAFVRMAAFYGFDVKEHIIERRSNYSLRVPNWAARPTHNDLRITRILRSLTLFGLTSEAKLFYDVAMVTVREIRGDTEVQRYWFAALSDR